MKKQNIPSAQSPDLNNIRGLKPERVRNLRFFRPSDTTSSRAVFESCLFSQSDIRATNQRAQSVLGMLRYLSVNVTLILIIFLHYGATLIA